MRKFRGPGAYEGLWELLARTYRALADGSDLPVTANHVFEVNRMVEALKPKDNFADTCKDESKDKLREPRP